MAMLQSIMLSRVLPRQTFVGVNLLGNAALVPMMAVNPSEGKVMAIPKHLFCCQRSLVGLSVIVIPHCKSSTPSARCPCLQGP